MAGKTALFLGGGAPNFTLMSGALLALHRAGIRFDIVSMAGAGAVVGLMYLVPKDMTQEQMLENTVNFGISDEIYRCLPVNFKAFAKWGPSADAFNRYWFSLPAVQQAAHQYGKNPLEKLQSDFLLMLGAMMCPSDLNPAAKGLAEHPVFIDSLIDFEKLKTLPQDIELNAFRLRDQTIVDFTKDQITPDHLRACLSFPFIYAPYKIGDEYYYEGAAFQCINPSLVPPDQIDEFIVLQPMTTNQIRNPRSLWDSYSQSVMMPVAALAQYGTDAVEDLSETTLGEAVDELCKSPEGRKSLKSLLAPNVTFDMLSAQLKGGFKGVVESRAAKPGKDGRPKPIPLSLFFPKVKHKWFEAKFDIAEDRLPNVFDWSRSNLEYLFDLGYVTGEDLAQDIHANRRKRAAKQ